MIIMIVWASILVTQSFGCIYRFKFVLKKIESLKKSTQSCIVFVLVKPLFASFFPLITERNITSTFQ